MEFKGAVCLIKGHLILALHGEEWKKPVCFAEFLLHSRPGGMEKDLGVTFFQESNTLFTLVLYLNVGLDVSELFLYYCIQRNKAKY